MKDALVTKIEGVGTTTMGGCIKRVWVLRRLKNENTLLMWQKIKV